MRPAPAPRHGYAHAVANAAAHAVANDSANAVASDGARVPILVHRPPVVHGWLVWAHGGSWQHGSAVQWVPITAALAARTGWAVASVDYRLAPRHRFPAAVLDVLAALDWAGTQAGGLPVAVGGDSAGGTIASLAALARRDAGQPVPPQVLAYPPMDPQCAGPSYASTPEAVRQAADLRTAWQQWLGAPPTSGTGGPTPDVPFASGTGGPSPSAPSASGMGGPVTPLQAAPLRGLAPVALVVGEHDPVRDDVCAYAARLRCAAVPVRLSTAADAGHADLLQPGSRVLSVLAAAVATITAPATTAAPSTAPAPSAGASAPVTADADAPPTLHRLTTGRKPS